MKYFTDEAQEHKYFMSLANRIQGKKKTITRKREREIKNVSQYANKISNLQRNIGDEILQSFVDVQKLVNQLKNQ